MATVYTDGSRYPTISRYLANRQTLANGELESMESVYNRWFYGQVSVKQNLDLYYEYVLMDEGNADLEKYIWRLQEWTSQGGDIFQIKVRFEGTPPDENTPGAVNSFHLKLQDEIRYLNTYNDVYKVANSTPNFNNTGNPALYDRWNYPLQYFDEDGSEVTPGNFSGGFRTNANIYHPDNDGRMASIQTNFVFFNHPDSNMFTVVNRNAQGEYDSTLGRVFGDLVHISARIFYYGPRVRISSTETIQDVWAVNKDIKITGSVPKTTANRTVGGNTYTTVPFQVGNLNLLKNTRITNYTNANFGGAGNNTITFRGSPEGGTGDMSICNFDITEDNLDPFFRSQW